MASEKTPIGIIGCGNISGIYFKNLTGLFGNTRVTACADLLPGRALAKAGEFSCRAMSVPELLAEADIKIVLNLTIPAAHAKVALAAIRAGKSVYNEKPLAIARRDGLKILGEAADRGLRVGCAPDTFLGAGIQTCRKLIDDGAIGQPVAATAFMTCHGHESWHPDPQFYYKPGGGPMFDMGPYYLACLVNLLGPVRRVSGSARVSFPRRTITSQPKAGTVIDVEVPTHVAGVMDFASGAVGTIITSFDIWAAQLPLIEIYGSEGSLQAPDPNTFGGPVRIRRKDDKEWSDVPLAFPHAQNSRGIGVADMVKALASGRAHRANGQLAYHVLDVMHAFGDSSRKGRHVLLQSTCDRPAPLPPGLPEGTLDE